LLWYMHTTTTGTGPFSYLWDFGDGNTSPQPTPSYTYAVAGHYAICLTVTDANGCSSTTCDSTYKMGSLGIIKYLVVTNPTTNIEEENFILVISVSPNPANEILSISSNQPIQGEIIITDIMGRKVFAEMIKDKISNINTSNFPRGYYYLSIVTADHVYYNKIMISR
ncbi:MAG TPA: PKD domain-containing protein, partial [Bacteroidia bacterium]|nr:PKD domain-containing protein [Bacteroidia bacterium]